MKAWNQITYFAGFDWAKDHHDVIVLDTAGKIVGDFRFEHTAAGWEQFQNQLLAFPNVAIAIETKSGTVIERMLELGCHIFPVHTQSAKAYRQRKVPSGNKTDRVDAWSLADALRLDGADWKQLAPQDPLVKELRLLCRDEVALIRDRTALITQLRQALDEASAPESTLCGCTSIVNNFFQISICKPENFLTRRPATYNGIFDSRARTEACCRCSRLFTFVTSAR
jgi:transposase